AALPISGAAHPPHRRRRGTRQRGVPIPPVLTRAASAPVRALRLAELPSEALALLRYGRAVDNRRYQTAGFRYRFTTAGAVDAFARGLRVRHAPRAVAAS